MAYLLDYKLHGKNNHVSCVCVCVCERERETDRDYASFAYPMAQHLEALNTCLLNDFIFQMLNTTKESKYLL